jgi:hypothetical protein
MISAEITKTFLQQIANAMIKNPIRAFEFFFGSPNRCMITFSFIFLAVMHHIGSIEKNVQYRIRSQYEVNCAGNVTTYDKMTYWQQWTNEKHQYLLNSTDIDGCVVNVVVGSINDGIEWDLFLLTAWLLSCAYPMFVQFRRVSIGVFSIVQFAICGVGFIAQLILFKLPIYNNGLQLTPFMTQLIENRQFGSNTIIGYTSAISLFDDIRHHWLFVFIEQAPLRIFDGIATVFCGLNEARFMTAVYLILSSLVLSSAMHVLINRKKHLTADQITAWGNIQALYARLQTKNDSDNCWMMQFDVWLQTIYSNNIIFYESDYIRMCFLSFYLFTCAYSSMVTWLWMSGIASFVFLVDTAVCIARLVNKPREKELTVRELGKKAFKPYTRLWFIGTGSPIYMMQDLTVANGPGSLASNLPLDLHQNKYKLSTRISEDRCPDEICVRLLHRVLSLVDILCSNDPDTRTNTDVIARVMATRKKSRIREGCI